MAGEKFPKAYLNTVNENDSMMERVPLPTMGIGARTSGLPKGGDVKTDCMTVKHVEDQNRK